MDYGDYESFCKGFRKGIHLFIDKRLEEENPALYNAIVQSLLKVLQDIVTKQFPDKKDAIKEWGFLSAYMDYSLRFHFEKRDKKNG